MSAPTSITPRTPNPQATNAAPFAQIVLAQTRVELLMTLRRGESLLITVLIPIGALIVTAALKVASISFLLPGILTLAIMSTGLVSLGIATAYER
ncbi:MAG TPA: ABC transporter permease, partial [Ktedonobacterales bacterium]|nr:ABC transporter permease [Ktedonobacterales bacterium]